MFSFETRKVEKAEVDKDLWANVTMLHEDNHDGPDLDLLQQDLNKLLICSPNPSQDNCMPDGSQLGILDMLRCK